MSITTVIISASTLARMRLQMLLLLVLAVPGPTAAQDIATDNELFAGYCYSALLGSGLMLKVMALQDCGSDDGCLKRRESGAALQRIVEVNEKRAGDYLRARRLFAERGNSLAWAGVQKAMEAATVDLKACTDNGRLKNVDQASCDRVARCHDLSRLPM